VEPRPTMVGYQTLRLDSSADAAENGRRLLAAYAEAEGYALATVFTEVLIEGRMSAYEALVAAIETGDVAAVAVPTLDDLGRMPRIREYLRGRLEKLGVRVLVAQSLADLEKVGLRASGAV
jgi:hypothetical protein